MLVEGLIGFINLLMINKMNWYNIVFERIYSLFEKGASINPNHEKLDGAIISILVFCCLLFINTLTVFLIIDKLFDYSIELNPKFGIWGMSTLILMNLLYFLSGKRYLKIKNSITDTPNRKRYTFFVLAYTISSIILFFALL